MAWLPLFNLTTIFNDRSERLSERTGDSPPWRLGLEDDGKFIVEARL